MTIDRLKAAGVCAALVAMFSLAGCGGDDSSSDTAGAGATPPSAPSAPSAPGAPASAQLTQFVNPLIGTAPGSSPNPTGHGAGGNTLPAAGLPAGMVQWGPDTNTTPAPNTTLEPGSPAGYYFDLNTIAGFSLTHMSGTGGQGNDGEFPILPTVGPAVTTPTFSHANEQAAPGYYAVTLDNQVKVELTATLRTGLGRFTYPADKPALVVLNATHNNTRTGQPGAVAVLSNDTLEGSTVGGGFEGNGTLVPVFFYAQFNQPFLPSSSVNQGVATLAFNPGATVLMKIGISYVSIANAKLNLEQENAGWDFDGVRQSADAQWEKRLETVQVTGGSKDDLTKFYTAFYHVLWAPSIFSDVNGQYLGLDKGIHTLAKGQSAQYSGISGWDIYRSLVPLQAFLFPTETGDLAQSLVNDADQCGGIPHWVNDNYEAGVMPGDAGSLIVAGAYAFGAQNFDTQGALAHMIQMANVAGINCNGTATNGDRNDYLKLGYIIGNEAGIASSTLEYTSSDFAISQFAGALGNAAMQKVIGARSAYWQNVLNTASTPPLLSGRNSNGTFKAETQTSTDNYDQGDAEQYTWMVPYNIGGLMSELGGTSAVNPRLDSFFTQTNAGTSAPFLYIGNEPGFATPWYYNWSGQPASTQALIHRIVQTEFTTAPGGLPGNDDMGATSSWYMWAMMGMYPTIPAVGGFTIGSPQFSSVKVKLENGKTLQINAAGAPDANFVQSLNVNGTAQTSTWVPFSAVQNGGTLDFAMASSPSSWGTGTADAPPSFGIPVATTIADAFDGNSAGQDGVANPDGTGADFDGQRNTYSASQFAAAGAVPGATLTFGGATFTWGNAANGLDNVLAVGQTILMPNAMGTTLVMLGASNNGPSSGTATMTFTDGTAQSFTMKFDDWTLNGGGATPSGDTPVITSVHRNTASGAVDTTKGFVFMSTAVIPAGKVLASVTLPSQVSAGKMHVFGLSVAP